MQKQQFQAPTWCWFFHGEPSFHLSTWLFLLSVVLSISSIMMAQEEQFTDIWRLAQFTRVHGSLSSAVISITATSDGVVWAQTTTGIEWYDGYQWHEADSALGLPHSTGGNLRSDGKEDVVVTLPGEVFSGNIRGFKKLGSPRTGYCIPWNKDTLLLFSDHSLHTLAHGHIGYGPDSAMTKGQSLEMRLASNGSIWVSLTSGLYRLHSGKLQPFVPSPAGGFVISGLDEDSSGFGIAALDYPERRGEVWQWDSGTPPHVVMKSQKYNFKSLAIGIDHEVFGITTAGELGILKNSRWRLLSDLNSWVKNITAFYPGKGGDLWIGTASGIYLYKRSSTRWLTWIDTARAATNIISEIQPMSNGDLWVGTAEGIIIHKKSGERISIEKIDTTMLHPVTGIAEDRDGSVWISSGSSFEGAFKWDGHRWEHVEITAGAPGIHFHKIRKDREGNLWFLGLSHRSDTSLTRDPAVYVLNNNHMQPWGDKEVLANLRVYDFAEDRDGARWFATSKGVHCYSKGAWKHWGTESGLADDWIFTLAIDSTNTVWFADRQYGLSFLDHQLRPHNVSTDSGLVSREIWDLTAAPDGALWIATSTGVNRLPHGIFTSYGSEVGLTQPFVWPLICYHDRLYCGTQGNGVAALDIADKDDDKLRTVLYHPIIEDEDALLRWNVYAYREAQPSLNIYVRYRVDSTQWSEWTTSREVTLKNLTSGSHIFSVQALSFLGAIDSTDTHVSFAISPPYYEQPVFLVPVALSIVISLYLAVGQFLERRKHTLALQSLAADLSMTEEKDRQNLAVHLHDTVGQALAFCKIKLGEITGTGNDRTVEEIRSHLNSAIDRTRSIMRDLSPPVLANMTFIESVEWLVQEMEQRHDICIDLRTDAEIGPLTEDRRLFLFHAVRELMTNVIKHSSAERIEIVLRRRGQTIAIDVRDTGKGFDTSVIGKSHDGRGFGLLNIRERIRYYGGKFHIESSSNEGTRVHIALPV